MPDDHVVRFSLALFHTGGAAQAEQHLRKVVNDYVQHRQSACQGEDEGHDEEQAEQETERFSTWCTALLLLAEILMDDFVPRRMEEVVQLVQQCQGVAPAAHRCPWISWCSLACARRG